MAQRRKTQYGRVPSGGGVGRAILKSLLVAAAAAIFCGAVGYGFVRMGEAVRAAPEYQVSRESLRLVAGPEWMTPAILAELDVTRELPERFSLLDPTIAARVAGAYERCVWIERVVSVVKRDPRVAGKGPPLEVRLKFRRPVAFVQVSGRDGFYLVDGRAVRLPGVYREPKLGEVRLLVIMGCREPPPEPGRLWATPALESGVRVADAVQSRREKFGLTTVDVSNFGGRRDPRETEVALYTENHTQIKWGKAPTPEAERLQEKSPAEKVGYLDFVYDRLEGRVDGVLSYIDIPNEAIGRRSAPDSNRLRS